ncbi:hypothetical protein Leryth_002676 [Lithospermum erythrorhizon]|nr:hypothetical protein Leryth_002676 [Lithospermum erythrorhizon]
MVVSSEDKQSPNVSDISAQTLLCSESNGDQERLGPNSISRNEQSTTPASLIRMILAEAVGSFILMFSICGIMASMKLMKIEVGLMEYAVTAALAVIIVVYSMGNISGAHVNPAVTIAFATTAHFPWYKVPLYIIGQVGGTTLGTFVGNQVYGIKSEFMMTTPYHGTCVAFWVEFIATFIILFLVASFSHHPKSIAHVSGFIIGGAIGLGVLISGPVSGGSMNPARSLGPAIISWNFEYIWIYIVAPIAGGIVGITLYRALRLEGWACKPN